MKSDRSTFRAFLAVIVLPGLLLSTAALPSSDEDQIRAALTQWMENFNAGRSDKVCDIFASDLRADNRGAPERDFAGQCELLRKVLGDPDRSLSYALDLKNIVVEGNAAAVRLVWTLTIREKATGKVSRIDEQGLDVFRRDADGRWRIIRFMTYERP